MRELNEIEITDVSGGVYQRPGGQGCTPVFDPIKIWRPGPTFPNPPLPFEVPSD